jgi:hypothetical protein
VREGPGAGTTRSCVDRGAQTRPLCLPETGDVGIDDGRSATCWSMLGSGESTVTRRHCAGPKPPLRLEVSSR